MPDVFPHSVIHGLPVMSFRGLDAPPYDVAGFDFSHSHGARPYPYIGGASHDWTGLDPHKLSFTLYFLNTLEPDAFPDAWEAWRKELFDGEPGEMVHPLLGPIKVVVRSGSVQLTASSTAGIVVQVSFETTIEDPEEEQTYESIALNITELAATAVAEAVAADIWTPSEQSALDITQIGDQLSGLAYSLELTALGTINKAQGIISDAIALPAMAEHTAYKARDAMIALWAALEDLGEQVGVQQERDIQQVKLKTATTVDAFARDRGNTIGEVMGLNPSALSSPKIPAGATLRYYTS